MLRACFKGVENKYFAMSAWTKVFFSKQPEAAGLIQNVVLEISFSGSCESGALPSERSKPVSIRLGMHEIHSNNY